MNYFFQKKKGFTLIETMIAIFILVFGITAVLHMFPLGIQIASSSKMATVAVYLAQEKMEENISKGYGGISDDFEDYNTISGFGSFKRETVVTCFDPNGSDSPDCSGSEDDTGIKKIEVTVFWKSPSKITRNSTKIATLVSEKK